MPFSFRAKSYSSECSVAMTPLNYRSCSEYLFAVSILLSAVVTDIFLSPSTTITEYILKMDITFLLQILTL